MDAMSDDNKATQTINEETKPDGKGLKCVTAILRMLNGLVRKPAFFKHLKFSIAKGCFGCKEGSRIMLLLFVLAALTTLLSVLIGCLFFTN